MTIYPNAKINIGLNIVAKREDGYHNIETVFYPIGLSDVLDVKPSRLCSDYNFLSAGIEIEGKAEDNLIIKAYRLLQSKYKIPPVDISLIKNIPFGAGLGGGSSDAAFMMKTLNELFQLKISTKKLENFATELGADCAFFFRNCPVFASGIGNVFAPIKLSLKGYFLLLVKPDIYVSTPEAYSRITPKQPEVSLKKLILRPIDEWKNRIVNDFEYSVFEKYPEVGDIKKSMYDIGAVYASMSGSGSSVYGIFKKLPSQSDIFNGYFVSENYLE